MQRYGASIDIGTSHVGINLCSLDDCKLVGHSFELNPQSVVGADILSRLKYHASQARSVLDLSKLIKNHIDGQLHEMLGALSLPLGSIGRAVIVGNSAMHHLFFDKDIRPLLKEPFVGINKHDISCTGKEIDMITLNSAEVFSPPLVGGFVGNDAIAVVVESGVMKQQRKAVLIDIGVNTEVGLYDEDKIYFASAASGPAFEEMSIADGMTAEAGAISTFRFGNESQFPNIETIGDEPVQGICGSGSISILAALLEKRLIDEFGTFVSPEESPHVQQLGDSRAFKVARGMNDDWILLTQQDIRMLQQSKAAIRAAIEVLFQEAKVMPEEVQHIFITGEFGASFSFQEAVKIGMFPTLEKAEIIQQPNGGLGGATKILCSADGEELCSSIADRIRYVNLTSNPVFDEQYAIHRVFE